LPWSDFDDKRLHELVLPALFLRVPEHPQIAETEDDSRKQAGEVTAESSTEADAGLDRVNVDHADVQRHLADRLALRPAVEEREVAGGYDELEHQPAETVHAERAGHDADREPDHDAVDDVATEAGPETGVLHAGAVAIAVAVLL